MGLAAGSGALLVCMYVCMCVGSGGIVVVLLYCCFTSTVNI